jgi:cytochrome c553
MKIYRLFFLSVLMSLLSFAADAKHGAELFDGTTAFKNGAVACVACHNVKSDKVISGGTLAMDLSAMGGAIAYTLESVDAMSSEVMKEAYEGKMLTKEEIADIDAFLVDAAANPGEGSGSYFVIFGLLLAVILYFLLSKFTSRKELKKSVNQDLYDRQIKSSWRDQ